jgi:hypothetical protein
LTLHDLIDRGVLDWELRWGSSSSVFF